MANNKRKTKRKSPAQAQAQTRNVAMRVVACVLAIVLIAAAALMVLQFCTPWKPTSWFDKSSNDDVNVDEGDGIQDGNFLVGGYEAAGAQFYAEAIAVEDYAIYGVSEEAESAVTVSVFNIKPESATNKAIDWTVQFGDAVDDSWEDNMEGKTVTDYITVTPSEDTLTLTVECLAPFGAPITVTGEFRSNRTLRLSFTCNYLAKIESSEFDVRINMGHGYQPVDTISLDLGYFVKPEITLSCGTVFPKVEVQNGATVSFTSVFTSVIPPNKRDFSPKDNTLSGTSFTMDEDFICGFFGDDFSKEKAVSYFYDFCCLAKERREQTGDSYGDLAFTVTYSVTYNGEVITNGRFKTEVIVPPFLIPVEGADITDTEIIF